MKPISHQLARSLPCYLLVSALAQRLALQFHSDPKSPPFLASVIFLCVTACSLFLQIQEASSEECMVLSPKILQICGSTKQRLLKYRSPCKQLWRQQYPRCVCGRWTHVCCLCCSKPLTTVQGPFFFKGRGTLWQTVFYNP